MATRLPLCAVDEVAEGCALRVDTGADVVAVFNVEGNFYVTDDDCTHGPGSLSEGYLEGNVVECDFHGGRFDVRTGEVVAPPCMQPVRVYPVVVDDAKLFIEVE